MKFENKLSVCLFGDVGPSRNRLGTTALIKSQQDVV